MNDAPSNRPATRSASAAGGVLIAIGAIGGAFAGAAIGEATRGFLIGLATGIALAGIIWWRGRR